MLDVVVLCGGRGSRMGSLTSNLPKTLVNIKGYPILWYIIQGLYQQGVRHFIFPVGFKHKLIDKYLSTLKLPGIRFSSIFTGEDTNIANRIHQIKNYIETDNFLIINGDCLSSFNLEDLIGFHKKKENLVTLLTCNITSPFGLISSNETGVNLFVREQKIDNFIDNSSKNNNKSFSIYSGICCITRESLNLLNLLEIENFEITFFNLMIELKKIDLLSIINFWYAVETQKDFDFLNNNQNLSDDKKNFLLYKDQLVSLNDKD